MSTVRVHNFIVSLDGFATGENQRLEAAFGDAQEQLWPWFETTHTWRPDYDSGGTGMGLDEGVAATWATGIGAEIMGRRKCGPQQGPWENLDWQGWCATHVTFSR